MPSKPEYQTQTIDLDEGPTTLHLYSANRGGTAYFATYNDYASVEEGQAAILAGARDGALKGGERSLLSEKDITLGDYPGKEIQVKDPNGTIMTVRSYLVDKRLYQVIVAKQEEGLTKEDQEFLDSFDIL
jgi:hypothetical protein